MSKLDDGMEKDPLDMLLAFFAVLCIFGGLGIYLILKAVHTPIGKALGL